jgi:cobalt-zinc-cadmium efflux system membrane fusion protein
MRSCSGRTARANLSQKPASGSNAVPPETTVELAASQLSSIKVEPVGTQRFAVDKEAVGSIDFDNNHSVQVFPPYQGKIIETFAD